MNEQIKFLLIILVSIFSSSADVLSQCAAEAGSDTTICLGGSVVIGGNPSGFGPGLSYSWSPSTGLSCDDCPNPTASPTTTQNYILTVTSSSGCSASSGAFVTVVPPGQASFTISGNNNCSNIPVNFNNTSTGNNNAYSWDFGDTPSGINNYSSLESPSHEFQFFGSGTQNFTVTLVVTSPGGCTDTIQDIVTIQASPGLKLIDPIDGFSNCDGSSFDLTVYDATPGGLTLKLHYCMGGWVTKLFIAKFSWGWS